VISAPDHSWPGFEAFFVRPALEGSPYYLIQVERREMARRLHRGETLERIVTNAVA
jgi:hypothetical protein